MVVAESQTAGYGKKKRGWFSPFGGLYFSIILKPRSLKELQLLTLAAGIAVVKVLNKELKAEACLKWPNDVLIEGKKVSGILAESVIREKITATIIGIGINTNVKRFPSSLIGSAVSFEKEIDNKKILKEILKELKKVLVKEKKEILKDYRQYEDTLGRELEISLSGKEVNGQAIDFDPNGDLIVKLKNKRLIKILEGDITYKFQKST